MSGAARLPDGERLYAIGDVHGRLDLLTALIARIRADNDARPAARVRIVLLGDIIDRGPASAEIVDRCRAITVRDPRFVVLKGNHEAMMIHALEGNFPALNLWLRHGGDAALRSWGVAEDRIEARPSPALLAVARAAVPAAAIDWLDGCPLWLEAGDYLFVHAGIRPGITIDRQVAEDLLWIRNEFLDAADDHGRVIVHGHSITAEGMVERPNRIGIDTGAYRTHVLTALALEGAERWSLATDGANIAGTDAPDALERDIAAILGPPAIGEPQPRRGRARALALAAVAVSALGAGAVSLIDRPPADRPAPAATAPLPSASIARPAPAAAPREPRAESDTIVAARTPTAMPETPPAPRITATTSQRASASAPRAPAPRRETASIGRPRPAEEIAAAPAPAEIAPDPAPPQIAPPPPTLTARAELPEAQPASPTPDQSEERRAARRRTLDSLDAIKQLRRQ